MIAGLLPRLLLQNAMWTAGLAALLFLPAGTLRWPSAWLYLVTTGVLGLVVGFWLARVDPDLLEERMKPMLQQGQPAADKWFMLVFGFVALAWFLLIGIDRRRQWSDMPAALQALGYFLLLAASAWMLRAVRENSFAAPVVKLQAERGQRVVDTGPYALVRHPMYSGVVLYFAAVALLLGSWWGLALSPVFFVLFAVRAGFEERALADGLPGYADYLARVRYRLLPGLW